MNLLVLKNEYLHDCQHLNEVTSGQAVLNIHRFTDLSVMVLSKLFGGLPENLKDANYTIEGMSFQRLHARTQTNFLFKIM